MFRGLGAIFYKETIHIIRDPRTLFLMLMIPGLQLTIFGFAIDLDVRDLHTVVCDLDRSQPSRDLLDAFENTGYFKITEYADSDADITRAIVRGTARVGIKIPEDYTARLLAGETASVQVLIDGSDSTVAQQALNTTNGIGLTQSINIVSRRLGTDSLLPLEMQPRLLFNPAMTTAHFIVPGLVGIIMQLVTMFLTAFSIVREKENGTIEQLMVTPVSRLGLMTGKLLPYACVGAFETTVVLLLMRFMFQVHIEGSVLLLAGFAAIFLFTALGLGLLVSTVAATQVEAMQWAFLIMLPSILLSGFIFPQETMPAPIYAIAQFIPVTYFIRILRGIILRGAGFADLWPQGLCLGLIGLALLLLSARRFHKTLA
ncbi:MAG: ABC transporter permease subunit [Candidatus Hydrogenedens sp.]|nr:ABC transporter permease subunit [Candidatus Hydrogenedens sp.]